MRYILFTYLIISATISFGGISIEEQKQRTTEKNNDSTKLSAFLKLSNYYLNLDLDSSLYYSAKGLELCANIGVDFDTKSNDTLLINLCAELYQTGGYAHHKSNNALLASNHFKRAMFLAIKINDLKSEADNLTNLAVIYTTIGDYIESIEYNHKALKIYRAINNKEGMANTLNSLSYISREQGSYENAIQFSEDALWINRTINNKKGEAKALNAIAGLKKIMGDTAVAVDYYEKSLAIYKAIDDIAGESKVLNNIGVLYKNQKNYDQSFVYFEQAYNLSEQVGSVSGMGYILENMGQLFFETNDIDKATEYANKALQFAKVSENITLKKRAYELLTKIYKEKKEWKNALLIHELFMEVNEKIINMNTKKLADKEAMRYAFEKELALEQKEQEQKRLLSKEKQRKQVFIYFAIGTIVLLLVFVILFGVQRLKKEKLQNKIILKQSNERKLMLQEIHHRVKNNFQIVSSLLRLQSYTVDKKSIRQPFEEAVSRINAMALVHDIIYKQEVFSEINTQEYLEKLTDQLSKSSGIQNVKIEIEPSDFSLKIETLIHIGIILNEFILNSFKYGFKKEHPNPIIKIRIEKISEEDFLLEYKENGIGIDSRKYQTSFGMELIETIIEQLKGEINISSKDEWKTVFTVSFKENDE